MLCDLFSIATMMLQEVAEKALEIFAHAKKDGIVDGQVYPFFVFFVLHHQLFLLFCAL